MNFQYWVIIIAIILLIVLLAVVTYAIKKNTVNANTWPPLVASCPDYFVLNKKTNKCSNPHNIGTCGNGEFDFSSNLYSGSLGNCSKYTWAKNCGVNWTGITSQISNPCKSTH